MQIKTFIFQYNTYFFSLSQKSHLVFYIPQSPEKSTDGCGR